MRSHGGVVPYALPGHAGAFVGRRHEDCADIEAVAIRSVGLGGKQAVTYQLSRVGIEFILLAGQIAFADNHEVQRLVDGTTLLQHSQFTLRGPAGLTAIPSLHLPQQYILRIHAVRKPGRHGSVSVEKRHLNRHGLFRERHLQAQLESSGAGLSLRRGLPLLEQR